MITEQRNPPWRKLVSKHSRIYECWSSVQKTSASTPQRLWWWENYPPSLRFISQTSLQPYSRKFTVSGIWWNPEWFKPWCLSSCQLSLYLTYVILCNWDCFKVYKCVLSNTIVICRVLTSVSKLDPDFQGPLTKHSSIHHTKLWNLDSIKGDSLLGK